MGTRNLTLVMLDGEYKVAQYCQWDGYPSGQGLAALQFVRDNMKLEEFKIKVKESQELSKDEHKQLWVECGAPEDSSWVSMDVSKKFEEKFPYLHRNCGADILKYIQDSENGLKLNVDVNFAADSLFCEWAYVVDLDKGTFEVFEGFAKSPLDKTERFYFLSDKAKDGYYPVKLKQSYSLSDLPTDEDFKAQMKRDED